jgi:hypothetical protein
VASNGLFESFDNRQAVEDAIDLANRVLACRSETHLRPAWNMFNAAPEDVPVYAVIPPRPGQFEVAFCKSGYRCIFIDTTRVPALNSFFSNNFKDASQQKTEHLLAITLLHEAGHIVHGDWKNPLPSAPSGAESGRSGEDVQSENGWKARELSADKFAGESIRGAMNQSKDVPAFTAAINIGSTVVMICFNLTSRRLLGDFGAAVLGDRQAFKDTEFTHPNLAYRLLAINNEINRSPESLKLLKDFEAQRAGP